MTAETLVSRPAFTEYARPPVADLGGRPYRRPGDSPIVIVGKPSEPPASPACPTCTELGEGLGRVTEGLLALLGEVSALRGRLDEHDPAG